MKMIIALILLLVVLAGCSNSQDEYMKTLEDWQTNRQTAEYQELQQEYNGLLELTNEQEREINQMEKELVICQNHVVKEQKEAARLNSIIASLPSQQVHDERWQEIIITRQALVNITNELELTSNNLFRRTDELARLTNKYNSLVAAIKTVNAKTDKTTTTNLTVEKRQHFNEMWALWYKAENVGQY